MTALPTTRFVTKFGGFTFAICMLFVLGLPQANAQSIPEPDEDPVEVSDFQVGGAANSDPRIAGLVVPGPGGYYSTMLQGEFVAQYMQISSAGRVVPFWGARILDLDPTSPLTALGLQPGDVITRLDKISIASNMSRVNRSEPWQIKQLERHYGLTKVRYIFHKTTQVVEDPVNLGPHRKSSPSPPGPPRRPVPLAP